MSGTSNSLKILITNQRLAKRTGTEMFVFDLARRLLSAGHRPVVYSRQLGKTARALRDCTVPVIDCLDQVGFVPDVIHGHHTIPTMLASLRFPQTPVLFICHSWGSTADTPPRLPTIVRYLAVDQACRDRLVGELGVPEECLEILCNFVDLQRFRRRTPLPQKPKRALLFTNRASFGVYYHKLKIACHRNGITLDRIRGLGRSPCESPESKLADYDLVFARAKSAIEALAVGAAVIICDRTGLGPLVTSQNFERLRAMNFGRRAFERPVTVENLTNEIHRYDARDAETVTNQIRQMSSLDRTVARLLAIYEDMISGFPHELPSSDVLLAATSRYLEQMQHPGEVAKNNIAFRFRRAA